MRNFILMDLIQIGNVGLEEDYVYLICGLAGVIIISYSVKPILEWAIRLKLRKLLGYLISSIFTILVAVNLSFLIENVNGMEVMKLALQSVSLYGILLMLLIMLKHFISRTS
ncbi:hypothetical protein [Oceanobacillus rekensis]|uniref:hypothetical protein n=1 Tax=Oceanobacillus rekensis TaxID=937927 RepID=UPI000B433949|nr:hypothetical protein [Oceanobacillus rekensis]